MSQYGYNTSHGRTNKNQNRQTNSGGSSNIKGGGRAELSNDLEAAVIDLLRSYRSLKRPLLPKQEGEEVLDLEKESLHHAKSNRRKFVKKLVTCYERHILSVQLNQLPLMRASEEREGRDKNQSKAAESTAHNKKQPSVKRDNLKSSSKKIRLNLVEAVYKNNSSSKSEKKVKWKPGSTKKTIVLEKATEVSIVLKQAKDKLKMKKKAVRCFYVEEKSKTEMDLTNNLEGLADGNTIYVTATPTVVKEIENDQSLSLNKEEEEDNSELEDPLNAVRQVYAQRYRRHHQERQPSFDVIAKMNADSKKFNLADLSPSRSQLPAAEYRRQLMDILEESRVLVICGATGCGKSTQIPQYILEAYSNVNIIVTQPRRVAAMALAERVAAEQGSPPPGQRNSTVGYHVRLDRSIHDKTTRLVYQTVGILLQRLIHESNSDDVHSHEDDIVEQFPLQDISHLIIDEVHERDQTTDFCLVILRRILVRNPNLKLILMSATNTPNLFCDYFRSPRLGIQPKVLKIPGRTFPVETVWLKEVETLTNRRIAMLPQENEKQKMDVITTNNKNQKSVETTSLLSPRAMEPIDNAFVSNLIFYIVNTKSTKKQTREENAKRSGAILVFLPGRGEIEALERLLRTEDGSDDAMSRQNSLLEIHILHSTVSPSNQRAVFQPVSSEKKTKVILATNIAETSITIPDVSVVIDLGRVKETRYQSAARIQELVTVWTSQASAMQRAGRAGRTGPGTCYRLYPSRFFDDGTMLSRTTPELLRTPLEELVLQSCLLLDQERNQKQQNASSRLPTSQTVGVCPIDFLLKTPDPPLIPNLLDACHHLMEIEALQPVGGHGDDGTDTTTKLRVNLTPLGYHLSQLPMDAKLGKLLLVGCILNCLEPALTIAAALSVTKPIFWNLKRDEQKQMIERASYGTKGDSIASIIAYEGWIQHNQRFAFCKDHSLDYNVLRDIHNLRQQFRECLREAGFDTKSSSAPSKIDKTSLLLILCPLVAGLYPHVATLIRPMPKRGGNRQQQGRLLTKDGDVCYAQNQSFQAERLKRTAETGKDVYAVYLSKHSILGTIKNTVGEKNSNRVVLRQINFVSRWHIILFGGNLRLHSEERDCLLVDEWLKFRVGSHSNAILLLELRRELDRVLLQKLTNDTSDIDKNRYHQQVIDLVIKILDQEA